MGIFSFIPVKEHVGKLWSLKLLVMVIAIINLVMGLAYALTCTNDILAKSVYEKRKCDFSTEIQGYLFFQICFIGLYLAIGGLLTIAFYIEKRQFCTDIVIVLLIVQAALSFALLAQFIVAKFSNESWNWSTCAFPNISYVLPFISAIVSNPFFVIYVNSFGEPLPGVATGAPVIAVGGKEPKPPKEKKPPKVYKKTETHEHK